MLESVAAQKRIVAVEHCYLGVKDDIALDSPPRLRCLDSAPELSQPALAG